MISNVCNPAPALSIWFQVDPAESNVLPAYPLSSILYQRLHVHPAPSNCAHNVPIVSSCFHTMPCRCIGSLLRQSMSITCRSQSNADTGMLWHTITVMGCLSHAVHSIYTSSAHTVQLSSQVFILAALGASLMLSDSCSRRSHAWVGDCAQPSCSAPSYLGEGSVGYTWLASSPGSLKLQP